MDDFSLLTLSGFTAGVFLWLVYGIAVRSVPVIAANGTTFVLAGVLLGLKLRYPRA